MTLPMMQNNAIFKHIKALDNLEVLRASFTTHSYSRHWHDTFGIGITERGVERFDYDGEIAYSTVGNVVLINPGAVHTGQAADTEIGWHYRIMYPSMQLVQRIWEEMTGRRSDALPCFGSPVVADSDSAHQLYQLFLLLDQSPTPLATQTVFVTTMAELLRRHACVTERDIGSASEHKAVTIARNYIAEHIAENVSLADLVDITGLSQYYFVRVFQKDMGVPPHTYQINLRIGQARRMLRDNQAPLSVALETGFTDQSHFIRHFKRIVGVTPKQYMDYYHEMP